MAEVTNNEQNFEEMLEESLKSLNTDEKVHGVVVGISPTEVYVDVGRKQAGFIPVSELSNDPSAKPEDLVKIGDEMDLLIMKTNDQEGTIMLSKRRVDAMKGWDEISEAMEQNEVLSGKVIEVVKGGVIVLYNAMRVFVHQRPLGRMLVVFPYLFEVDKGALPWAEGIVLESGQHDVHTCATTFRLLLPPRGIRLQVRFRNP